MLEILKGQDGEEKVDFGQFKVESLNMQLLFYKKKIIIKKE